MSLHFALLGMLCYKPMTGYDLKKLFDESINNFWAAHISQIYRELGLLEKEGNVTSEIEAQQDKPDKRIYSITNGGRQAFHQWMENPPEKISKETRDEFTLRIFFASEVGREELIKMLERFLQQKVHERDIGISGMETKIEKFSAESNNKQDGVYWRLIGKRALMTNATLIQWAEESIEELKNLD